MDGVKDGVIVGSLLGIVVSIKDGEIVGIMVGDTI